MSVQLLIGYFLLLGIIVSNYAVIRLNRKLNNIRLEKELAQIFFWYWDGTPEDRLYAWYKVRSILKLREGEEKKIEVVDRKIIQLNKNPMLGDVSVTESGELVDGKVNLTIDP